MFARITPYKLKPGSIDGAVAKAEELKSRIMGLPGVVEFINAVDDDGNGYIVSVVESRETSDANADKVRALWGEMSEFLAEPPTPGGYDIKMHWKN